MPAMEGPYSNVVDDLNGGYNEMQFSVTRSTFYANHCNRQGGDLWATINGKKEYVEIFEILAGEPDERKALKLKTKAHIEKGVEAYLVKNYSLAVSKFRAVLDIDPDDEAAKYYLQKASAELDVMV